MRSIIIILFLIITASFANSSEIPKEIIGGWETEKIISSDGELDKKTIIWKYYHKDGKVNVIYGREGGLRIKESFCGIYIIKKNLVIEKYPHWEDELKRLFYFKNEKMYQEVDFGNLGKEVSIFIRKEKPDSRLLSMDEIPADIEGVFAILSKQLDDNEVKRFKNISSDEINNYHFSMGLSIRNSFQLWRGSKLKTYFKKNKVYIVDNMSSIIMTAYWRHLNNIPLKLEEDFKFYEKFTNYYYAPTDFHPLTLKDGTNLRRLCSMKCFHKSASEECRAHVYLSEKNNEAWIYEYETGLYKPDDWMIKYIVDFYLEIFQKNKDEDWQFVLTYIISQLENEFVFLKSDKYQKYVDKTMLEDFKAFH